MNLTLFGAIALMAFVSDSNGEFGGAAGFGAPAGFGGPGGFGGPAGFAGMFAPPAATAGKMAGQEASKNAVDLAVNSAMTKVNVTELPPELQVTRFDRHQISNVNWLQIIHIQSLKIVGRTATSNVGYRIRFAAM